MFNDVVAARERQGQSTSLKPRKVLANPETLRRFPL